MIGRYKEKHSFVFLLLTIAIAVFLGVSAKTNAADEPATLQEKLKDKAENLSWGGDPFILGRAGKTQAGPLSGITLIGIIWDEKNPCALINNEVVKIGDKIDDCTVIEIRQDSVTVIKQGQVYTLKVWQGGSQK